MKKQEKVPAKTCTICQNPYQELYDSYNHTCPACTLGYRGTLRHTEGGWVWKQL